MCFAFFAYGHCIDLTGKEKRAAGSGDPGVWACGKNAGTRRTGNLLRDPISGRPVCVVSEDYKEKWKIPTERMRLIAYETVAGQDFMEIVAADKFLMKEAGKMVSQKEILLGFGKASLFQGKNYQMILHKDFCWE